MTPIKSLECCSEDHTLQEGGRLGEGSPGCASTVRGKAAEPSRGWGVRGRGVGGARTHRPREHSVCYGPCKAGECTCWGPVNPPSRPPLLMTHSRSERLMVKSRAERTFLATQMPYSLGNYIFVVIKPGSMTVLCDIGRGSGGCIPEGPLLLGTCIQHFYLTKQNLFSSCSGYPIWISFFKGAEAFLAEIKCRQTDPLEFLWIKWGQALHTFWGLPLDPQGLSGTAWKMLVWKA